MSKGYMYFRDNELCVLKNIIKQGITKNIKDRENGGYITNEHEYGNYILVYEFNIECLEILDNLFKYEFQQHNNYKGKGTEFYDRNILTENKIDLFFYKYINDNFKKLSNDEIENINRSLKEQSNNNSKVSSTKVSTDSNLNEARERTDSDIARELQERYDKEL
jgi:hypothetical protein